MEFSDSKSIDVTCIGHALMDILVEVEDTFLAERDLKKGGMFLVGQEESEKQLKAIADRHARTLPGGASANTARGVGAIGGKAVFFGSVGTSMYGEMYKDALEACGVRTYLHQNQQLTGNAITYITPDHERTFSVHLGAAAKLEVSTIDTAIIADSKIIHLEAFQLEGETRVILEKIITEARAADTLISLDLNDVGVIERNIELFKNIVSEQVDILFANETEGAAFTGEQDILKILEKLKGVARIVVLKCGADGAHIIHDGEVVTVAAAPTNVVDTTGAGDLFAAGFLFGLTHSYSIEDSGALGARAAAAIISQIGVDTSVIEKLV